MVYPDAFTCPSYCWFRLVLTFVSFLQVATYMKNMAKRAYFSKGSTRAVEAYKAEVASLTLERADL